MGREKWYLHYVRYKCIVDKTCVAKTMKFNWQYLSKNYMRVVYVSILAKHIFNCKRIAYTNVCNWLPQENVIVHIEIYWANLDCKILSLTTCSINYERSNKFLLEEHYNSLNGTTFINYRNISLLIFTVYCFKWINIDMNKSL